MPRLLALLFAGSLACTEACSRPPLLPLDRRKEVDVSECREEPKGALAPREALAHIDRLLGKQVTITGDFRFESCCYRYDLEGAHFGRAFVIDRLAFVVPPPWKYPGETGRGQSREFTNRLRLHGRAFARGTLGVEEPEPFDPDFGEPGRGKLTLRDATVCIAASE